MNDEKQKLLRKEFSANQISKLPKPTKAQTDAVKRDFKTGVRCTECGGWHHPKVVHLDYVGHAALTDRLLDVDPLWNWEPLAMTDSGQPVFDNIGGMWIKLTICGVTRLGYGNADGKQGGNAIKEVIGDALRNAGMRFGLALDLWHKGELHDNSDDEQASVDSTIKAVPQRNVRSEMLACKTPAALMKVWESMTKEQHGNFVDLKEEIKVKLMGAVA